MEKPRMLRVIIAILTFALFIAFVWFFLLPRLFPFTVLNLRSSRAAGR